MLAWHSPAHYATPIPLTLFGNAREMGLRQHDRSLPYTSNQQSHQQHAVPNLHGMLHTLVLTLVQMARPSASVRT